MGGNTSRRLENEHFEHVDSERERSGNTRRSFLKDVGKKAIYVTPVVMTLSAERAQASARPQLMLDPSEENLECLAMCLACLKQAEECCSWLQHRVGAPVGAVWQTPGGSRKSEFRNGERLTSL